MDGVRGYIHEREPRRLYDGEEQIAASRSATLPV
jgi:hypothetical protein